MLSKVRRHVRASLLLALAVPAALAAAPSPQQPAPDVERRLARVLEQADYAGKLTNTSFGTQWFPGEDRFIYWASPAPGEGRWVVVDAASGTKANAVEPRELRSQLARLAGREVTLPLAIAYRLDGDGKALSFRFEGKAYSLDFGTRRLSSLAEDRFEALALDPSSQASPGRELLARQKGGGIEILDRSGKAAFRLAGEEHYEWRLPAKSWSPDGRALLAWRMDSRRVHKVPIVENDEALERVRYVANSKTGTPLAVPELHLVDPRTGTTRRIGLSAAEGYSFLAGWRKGEGEALVLHLGRDGKTLDLYGASIRTGAVRRILREERLETSVADLGFILEDWARQLVPLETGFLWMSERDGWRHVYRYDYSGRLRGRLTRGRFPVHEVAFVAPDERSVFLLASADRAAPYDRIPYRVAMTGGPLVPLSSEPGIHRVSYSSTGRYLTSGSSTPARPTIREVAATDGSRRSRYEAFDDTALRTWGFRPPEPFVATAADGRTAIHGVIYKPHDFDPAKKYPVIDHIYGGPFVTSVPHDFYGDLDSARASALAEAGFVVLVIDARGSPGRSKAFKDATYGRIGQIEIPDHVAAIRQAAASRPYMDLGRVGITGHSWGGYFALRAILTETEFFKASYAGAPGDLLEEAAVNEPNMGLPAGNPEGYRAGSNVLAAGRLKGALKLMHGTADTSASLVTTIRMADALIEAGKRFELLLMPGVGHSPRPPKSEYYLRDVALFFMKELGGPR